MLGVTFVKKDGVLKHTFNDWKLRWLEPYTIGYPEVKNYEVDVPGADGTLDLTESLTGTVRYKNRPVELNFESQDKDYFEYEKTASKIARFIHGKTLAMILDTDPNYHYIGRFKLNRSKSSKIESVFTITGDVMPYKYEDYTISPLHIMQPTDFQIEDLGILQSPRFLVSNANNLTVGYKNGDKDYILQNGSNEIPYIEVGLKPTELLFKGEGTVIIEVKKGML